MSKTDGGAVEKRRVCKMLWGSEQSHHQKMFLVEVSHGIWGVTWFNMKNDMGVMAGL